MKKITRYINERIFAKLGYKLIKTNIEKTIDEGAYIDIKEQEFWDIYNLCKLYTMTSVERMYALYRSVDYVLTNNIEGDFIECGVWRGGSSMMIAQMLSNRNITNRTIHLYDTFEGMSEPTNDDVSFSGQDASTLLEEGIFNKETSVWCYAGIEDVQANLKLTQFPQDKLVFVKGKVEDTLTVGSFNQKIALLRLDTDWYESTKHELICLYPSLSKNGILIIDDYGHWEGCRKAVDEYFEENRISLLLNRIDYTGRIAVKNIH